MSIDTETGPHAVKPITDFLTRFTPVQKSVSDPDNTTLTYDILNWIHAPQTPPPAPNAIYGTLTVQRKQRQADILYHIQQQTRIAGQPTHFNADVTCNLDDTLVSWALHTYRTDNGGNPIPISKLQLDSTLSKCMFKQRVVSRIDIRGCKFRWVIAQSRVSGLSW